ncbi:CsbD family protein [Arcanobacterium haemolyticum]|nr:CsbD family protein [Arcanobacterium haemolyticum]
MSDESVFDKAAGKAKEVAGKVTGDKNLEAEGKLQNLEGKVKDFAEDAKAGIKAVGDKIKDVFDGDESK